MAREKANQPAIQTQFPPAFIQLLGQMETEATAEDNEFGSPTITSVAKILDAATEDEMWDADDLDQTGGRDLVDKEQLLITYAVKWSTNPTINSAFKDSQGRGMYLLIRSASIETGEEFVWNTSAPLIVGKVMWLANREMLPHQCVIKGKDQGAGQVLLKLKPIPKRAIQGEPPF